MRKDGRQVILAPVSSHSLCYRELEALVEGTGDDLVLLILREVVEVNGIAGNTHGELRVLLRMGLGVEKRVTVEHVDVQVVATLLAYASIMLTRLSACACGISATFMVFSFSCLTPQRARIGIVTESISVDAAPVRQNYDRRGNITDGHVARDP